MAYVLAVLAALSFAFGSVLQQRGALETSAPEGDPRFLTQVIRRPAWIIGGLCQVLGWILQAVALDKGSLIVVQSLTMLSLVFALPLGRAFTKQVIVIKTWLGAASIVVGLVVFLGFGSPQGGTTSPSASSWWISIVVVVVASVVLYFAARHRRGAPRAVCLGLAAGLGFGLQASVTKVFVGLVGSGLVAILESWTVYVLIVSALGGFALQQSALKTGALAPAMASSNAATLLSSVILGVVVFDEAMTKGRGHTVPTVIGLVLATFGIATLATTPTPDTST